VGIYSFLSRSGTHISLGGDWESEGEGKWEDVNQSMPALLQDYINPAPPGRKA